MKSKTFSWLTRTIALLLSFCLICACLTGVALATETEPETLEEVPTEPSVEPEELTEELIESPEVTTEEPSAEPEYRVEVEEIDGYFCKPVDLIVSIEDVGGTGWEKVEASLDPDDPELRTDLTEELRENDMAVYTVSENGTVYFFITDPEGVVHQDTYTVSCFDYDPPRVEAGIRNVLLCVEASDALSGVAGIYVNDRLYTTLKDGVLELPIGSCTDEPLFYIQAKDLLGNRSGYVVLSNPYYEEPVEDEPEKPQADSCTENSEKTETAPVQSVTPSMPTVSTTGTSSGAGVVTLSSGTQSSTEASNAASEELEAVTLEPGEGFSENGSAVTRDLLYDKYTNKQFITIQTRSGETFYVVIDYDKPTDEEGEQYETYFLNLVDDADLAALLDDGTEPVCTCTKKCTVGDVNTDCEVCRNDLYECACWDAVTEEPEELESEPEPETETTPEPEEPEEQERSNLLLPVVLLMVAAGGGAVYFFKFRKNKPDTRGSADLDDYDYGEDDDTEYETEEEPEETEEESERLE